MNAIPSELQRLLSGLRFQPRRRFRGSYRGERAVTQRGTSTEFRDHREYGEGDDLRHLDWNALARLDSALTKTYRDDQDLLVAIWLDGSASMRMGTPEKFGLAQLLAMALGWTALTGGERVSGGRLGQPHRSYRGRSLRSAFLQALTSEGSARSQLDLIDQMRHAQIALPHSGVIVLVTDGMHPDFPRTLATLPKSGNEVWLLQVLSREELEPDLEGDLRLVDCEGHGSHDVTANSATLTEYRRRLDAHLLACEQAAVRGGGRYARILADEDPVTVIKSNLLRGGWLA